ncbi:MAG: hypothetical protein WAV05_06160 [Anaerolineales bacterium]
MINQEHPLLSSISTGAIHFSEFPVALLDIQFGLVYPSPFGSSCWIRLSTRTLQQAGANFGASFKVALGKSVGISERGQLFENCIHAHNITDWDYEIQDDQ